MEKHVLSDMFCLAGQMTCLLTKVFAEFGISAILTYYIKEIYNMYL